VEIRSDIMTGEEPVQEKELILGGETVAAKDEFLKTIINMFYKINGAADGKSLKDLQWILNYYTDILISFILKAEARDEMRVAKDDIYAVEILKIKLSKAKGEEITEEEIYQAKITACTVIVGEMRNFLDKYFGFEQQLAVFV
jgi:hypothetical protein